jgi:Na+(H+)/acetate symporter ActP
VAAGGLAAALSTAAGLLLAIASSISHDSTIPVWWQKKRYCSDMSNIVSAIDGTSHQIQIPSNEPQ